MLLDQNDRELIWIYDPIGNSGKTTFCKELGLHHDAACFANAGKKDLAFAYDDQPIICFNLTRTTTDRVNYESMEALKDGLLFSAKYGSETKIRSKCPSMVIMSNTMPNLESMSDDRWCIFELKEGALSKLPSPILQETGRGAFCDEEEEPPLPLVPVYDPTEDERDARRAARVALCLRDRRAKKVANAAQGTPTSLRWVEEEKARLALEQIPPDPSPSLEDQYGCDASDDETDDQ